MSNISIDLPTELTETIAHAQHTLILRQRAEEDTQRQQIAAQAARIAETWTIPLDQLRAALPDWIHQYIAQPDALYQIQRWDADHAWYEYSPAVITVPGCNDIAAWVDRRGVPHYEIFQPKLDQDEDGNWDLRQSLWQHRRNTHSLDEGETDIAVTLLRAHQVYLQRLDLEAAAAKHNAAQAPPSGPAPEPEPEPTVADPIDQARTLLSMLSNSQQIKQGDPTDDPEDLADDRTLVLASVGLAIAHHLRRAADALESINRSI